MLLTDCGEGPPGRDTVSSLEFRPVWAHQCAGATRHEAKRVETRDLIRRGHVSRARVRAEVGSDWCLDDGVVSGTIRVSFWLSSQVVLSHARGR